MRCDVVPYGKAIIIDDSYKSNPESVKAAIESLNQFKGYQKVVCLSDMLELGSNEDKYHKEIGSYIKKDGTIIDLICTGELSKYTANKGNGIWYETREECAKHLSQYQNSKVVILVKGSNAMGMNKVVKLLKEAEK